MITSSLDTIISSSVAFSSAAMYCDEDVDELTDDDLAIRAEIEARRVSNAIPDHLLPCCRPFPTDTEANTSGSLAGRLLVAVYNGQMWLLSSALETLRTITNAVWRTDQQVCHHSAVHIHSCTAEPLLIVIGLNDGRTRYARPSTTIQTGA